MRTQTLGLTVALLLAACGSATSGDAGSGGGAGKSDGGAGGGGGGGGGSISTGSLVDVATANPDLSLLVGAIQKAGMTELLADATKQYSLFAPTNRAFVGLLVQLGITSGLEGLTAEQLRPILKYHVLGQALRSGPATVVAAANETVLTMGGRARLSLSGSTLRIDGRASVTKADVAASNGVIHVIDQLLLPSISDIVTSDPDFAGLAVALVQADTATPSPNLVATLDEDASPTGFTVFAPTNDGFTTFLDGLQGRDTGIADLSSFRGDQLLPVLRYHLVAARVLARETPSMGTVDVVGGKVSVVRTASGVTVDGAPVVFPDLVASNGFIHVIGKVLLPSITDVVTTDVRFSSLKAAALAADGNAGSTPKVAAALDGTQAFTLFAPSNAAFSALPMTPSGQALTNVLLYHAAPGNPVFADAALRLTMPLSVATALSGQSLSVAAEGMPRGVTVADSTSMKAKVVQTNLFCANGVIHVVDKVLAPSP
jgi:transforming growth factor-beta-induced protein